MRIRLILGLILAALLGLADLALPFGGDDNPVPLPVALTSAVLGLITIAAAVIGRRGNRAAVTTVVVTRVLSALGALPAFFVADVPAAARISAAVIIVSTLVVVALLLPALRKR